MRIKKISGILIGLFTGFLNGLFGAGGGMIAVPMLEKSGLKANEAHATSLAIILPLSLLSGFLYLRAGSFTIADTLVFLPGGLIGALTGAFLLPRIKTLWLRRIFAVVVLFSAVRLLIK